MLKVGITGGIGSGKSVVSGLFAQLGVPVFDSDKEARKLIDSSASIRAQLTAAFGCSVYLPGNQGLDRKKVATLVFQDEKALETLNAITHPPVIQAAADWMESQEQRYQQQRQAWLNKQTQMPLDSQPPLGYVIKEAALLFESGTDKPLDFIIGVYADKQTRLLRVGRRDHLSEEAIQKRMDKQMNEEKKMDLCDGVIFNDGQQLLWPEVLKWHRYFQKKST